jgi:hypothetical protein
MEESEMKKIIAVLILSLAATTANAYDDWSLTKKILVGGALVGTGLVIGHMMTKEDAPASAVVPAAPAPAPTPKKEDCEELTNRERLLYEIEKAEKVEREAMDKVVALKLRLKEESLVKLEDIVPGVA